MKKLSLLISVFLAFSMVLAACQTPAPATPAAPTQAPAAEPTKLAEPTKAPEATQAPAQTQTLIVWDQFYRDVESKVMETLNAEFEAAHPGVKIERVVKNLDDLKVTEKLALSKADGPDVAQVNQGRSDMGALVEANLLMPLNDYSAKLGWDKIITSSIASRNSFTADGKTMGSGNIYGVSPTAEVVGVYYNKGLFQKNNWQIPTTFEDFMLLLAKIKAAGVTPISFGSLDGWNAIHEFSAIQHLLVSPEYINDLVYGVNNGSFDTPENQQAAQLLLEASKAGYFTDGYAGIGYDDSNKTFKAGQGAMTVTGSWLASELIEGTNQQFGFFLLPGPGGKPSMAIGGVGIPFAIRQGTPKADLAAEYLSWMISPRAAQLWAEISYLPAMEVPAETKMEKGSLFEDTLNAWQTVNKASLVGHYIDWATPTFYDTLVAELQKLLGGVSTPAEFTAAVEKDYSAFLAKQK
ncbi:MAG: extracellular solute-binding protein [Anaerolineaceae bacterium]|nr:extracellular solute-binding protein [Anaerolineaceae bacterium]